MKKFITVVILVCVLLITSSCSTAEVKGEPEISLKFNVSNLTEDEFKSVGTKGLDSASGNDFRNIEFSLDVKHSGKISNRKITIPDVEKASNSYDKGRYWFGSSYSQDNPQENFANYGNKFVFYSKGLDEETVRNLFNSEKVRVSWTTDDGIDEERVYKLGEVIKFN